MVDDLQRWRQSAMTNATNMASARGGRLWQRFSGTQALIAVIVSLGALLALNFSSRIQLDRELQDIHAEVKAEIERLQIEHQALQDELQYVKSDAYVEYWARDDGKLIREGEILIVPKGIRAAADAPATNVQLVEFVTTEPKPENWQLWWALFFDTEPPQFD